MTKKAVAEKKLGIGRFSDDAKRTERSSEVAVLTRDFCDTERVLPNNIWGEVKKKTSRKNGETKHQRLEILPAESGEPDLV